MWLLFEAGVKYRGKIYFSSMCINGLFSYDVTTDKTSLLGVFEKERIREFLHTRAFLYQNEMWLIPRQADNIAVVNLDTLRIKYFEIPDRDKFEGKYAYIDGIRDGDILYLIPVYANSILKINMKDRECSAFCKADFFPELEMRGGYVYNGTLNVMNSEGRIGLQVCTATGECLYKEKPAKKPFYQSAVQTGEDFWIIPFGTDIIRRQSVTDVESYREIKLACGPIRVYRGIDYGNEVIFFPNQKYRRFLWINKYKEEVFYTEPVPDGDTYSFSYEVCPIDSDEGSWAASDGGTIFEFLNDRQYKTFHAELSEDLRKNLINYYKGNEILTQFFRDSVKESKPMFSLQDLICSVTGCE